MIFVSHLYKFFDKQRVIDDITFEVKKGEIVTILGESGSGKSVLLRHLIGLLKPDQGKIEIDGIDITRLPERELLVLRKNIGYLFQEGALYDFLNVFENIAFPLWEHTNLKKEAAAEKVRKVLEVVDLEGVEQKYPSELSGGMRKRVGLARAIIMDSKILLCDEPTSGLDPIRSRDISDLIKEVSKRMECTTIITSHDIDNSLRISNRIILIHDGKIVAEGKPFELKASTNSFVAQFMGV